MNTNKLIKIYGWYALFCVALGAWMNFILIYKHFTNDTFSNTKLLVSNLIALGIIALIGIFALRKWKPIIFLAFLYFCFWSAPMKALMPNGFHFRGESIWSSVVLSKEFFAASLYTWAMLLLAIGATVGVMVMFDQICCKRSGINPTNRSCSTQLFNYIIMAAIICLVVRLCTDYYSFSFLWLITAQRRDIFVQEVIAEIFFCLGLVSTVFAARRRQWIYCMLLFAYFITIYYQRISSAILSLKELISPNMFAYRLFWGQFLIAYTTFLFYLIFAGWVVFYIKERLETKP